MMCKFDKNRLLLYLFDELEEHERDVIRDHVRQCGQCRKRLEEYNFSRDFFDSLPKPGPPELRVVSQVLPSKPKLKKGIFTFLRRPRVQFGVAFVVLCVLLSLFLLLKPGKDYRDWTVENSWEGPYQYHLNKIEQTIETIKNDQFYN